MTNLENATTKELKEMAKEQHVPGWWKMKKEELIEALSNEAPVEAVEEIEVEAKEVVEEAPTKKNQKRLIEYNGKIQTLNAWAKELGIRHQTLYNRIVIKGWDVDKAFEAPTKKEKATEELVEA